MAILALGVSYRRASVELLERLSFAEDDLPKAYRRLIDGRAVREGVILSTCNRVEVYGEVGTYHAGFLELKRFLIESRELAPEDLAEPLYSHYEDHAADHLLSVASGVDSMVLGEPQILSQVRAAYRRAQSDGATGPQLSALFRAAIRTGRRAHVETGIGAAPSALVDAGLALAGREMGGLAGRSATVIGAGGMAGLAAERLRRAGLEPIRIVNRSPDRAESLARRTGARAVGLDRLVEGMAGADVVVSATGAAGLVVGPEAVRGALGSPQSAGGPSSPPRVVLLDLAVPRDIDPSVAEIPGARLLDIDDLREDLQVRGADALAEADRVREIVAEEVERYAVWRRASRLSPLIRALRAKGAGIQAAELRRAAGRLSGLSEREREAVQSLAEGIVAKLLHDPIVRLKERSGAAGGDVHARALAELFGIELPRDP